MNMKNVKAMSIPDGTVKKIEDANGNIIWGSYDAFPYRRLEYVHFNGNDYISTSFTPWDNFGFYLDIQFDANQTGQFNGHGKVVSNNRAFIGTEGGGKVMYGSGQVSASVSNSNVYERHTYQVNTSSSTNGKFYIDGTQVATFSSYYQQTNRGTMFVGGVYRNTGEYSLCREKVYNVKFINNVSSASPTVAWNFIPAQRKSDGAIGFYNIKSSGDPVFLTSVNGLLEAGPVADEYWDLTAPA